MTTRHDLRTAVAEWLATKNEEGLLVRESSHFYLGLLVFGAAVIVIAYLVAQIVGYLP